jgi:hypothetical protein
MEACQVRSRGGREIETLVLIKKINPPGIQLNPRHASQGDQHAATSREHHIPGKH